MNDITNISDKQEPKQPTILETFVLGYKSMTRDDWVMLGLTVTATYSLIGAVYCASRLGTMHALQDHIKALNAIDANVFFNADVTYKNVQDTVYNGQKILDAIAQAQPVIDQINAIKPG